MRYDFVVNMISPLLYYNIYSLRLEGSSFNNFPPPLLQYWDITNKLRAQTFMFFFNIGRGMGGGRKIEGKSTSLPNT